MVGLNILGYFAALIFLGMSGRLATFASWYLTALLLLFIVEKLINLPHHAETPLLKASERALPFWQQEKVTHACRTIPIWSNCVLLNFNRHIAHHYFPMIPWNLLPL
jgi:omega-6 fatty acid desaturase (delta-12 desaturase)